MVGANGSFSVGDLVKNQEAGVAAGAGPVASVQSAGAWEAQIVRDSGPLPLRMVLYSVPGCGKSTLASTLPTPLVIDWDDGLTGLRVDRVPGPKTWGDTLGLIRAIGKNPGKYKSLVLDTIDGAELLASDQVCREGKKESLSDFGYGSGFEALSASWRVLLSELDQVRARGLMICLLAHATVRQANDPQMGQFDQWSSTLNKKTWSSTTRWADCVFFAAFDSAKLKDEKRVIVTANRVVYTTASSGLFAKNRSGLPLTLPLSWPAISLAIEASRVNAGTVAERIETLAKGTPFVEKAQEFIRSAAGDVRQLLQVEDALKTKLAEAAQGAA
jgi:hypothetical protein